MNVFSRQKKASLGLKSFKFLKGKSGVDKIIVEKQPYQLINTNREFCLKDKSGVDKIIVNKQP